MPTLSCSAREDRVNAMVPKNRVIIKAIRMEDEIGKNKEPGLLSNGTGSILQASCTLILFHVPGPL